MCGISKALACSSSTLGPTRDAEDSDYGSEGGPEALEAYLNTKTVAMTSV